MASDNDSKKENIQAEDPFLSTTMRIDIPPEILKQTVSDRSSDEPTSRQHRKTQKIKITTTASGTPLGDHDFQELLQSIYDGALITNPRGEIIGVNVRALQFLQYEKEEIIKSNVVSIISGANESLLSTIWKTLENDRFVLIQAYCTRKDGSTFPAEISVNRLRLSTEDYLSFFIRDITLRKQAEEQLRTGYNAMQNSGNGIAIADIEANFEYCNPALLKLWGYKDPSEVKGQNLRTFLVNPDRAEKIIQKVKQREVWGGELQMKMRDDQTFFVQASVAANLNSDGELIGMVLSLQDITERKIAQQKLEDYANQLSEKNQMMQDDLTMAQEIQFAFLPRSYPVFPPNASDTEKALTFGHVYHPSGEVGGDFFDLIRISDTEVGIFISDVMGHGMRAALVVATIRGLIEQLAGVADDPGKLLTKLNQAYTAIFQQTGQFIFATALYCVIDITTGIVKFTSAGHPLPFLLHRDTTSVEELLPKTDKAKGSAIGLFATTEYQSTESQLGLNDMLIFYTDGLSETSTEDGQDYESMRLKDTLGKNLLLPPHELLPILVKDAQNFSGKTEFEDDVCLLGVEINRILGN